VIAPLTGEIVAVNDQLSASPQAINEDPYGQGWLVKIRLDDSSGVASLMDAERYVSSLTGARDQT